MPNLINIDTSDPDLLKPPEFRVLPAGIHTFAVANDLSIADAKSGSGNQVVNIELRCQDDGENKGLPVFDNIVIVTDPSTDKARKTQKIHRAKMVQFAIACGLMKKEDIAAGKVAAIDLTQFKDKFCKAFTTVEVSIDKRSNTSRQQSRVARYVFE